MGKWHSTDTVLLLKEKQTEIFHNVVTTPHLLDTDTVIVIDRVGTCPAPALT